MSPLLDAWSRYWFRATPLVNLAVCRILIVGVQLKALSNLDYWREAAPAELYDPLPILHLMIAPIGWMFRPSEALIDLIHNLTLGAGLLALVGLFTNIGLVVFAAGSTFLTAYQYSFGSFHHPEAPIIIALMILALSPAGGALSVDDLRQRVKHNTRRMRFAPARILDRTSEFAGWPLSLIQWILVLVYLSAAYSKLSNGGVDWVNGYTLQYYLVQDGFRFGSELSLWLGDKHVVAEFLSWMTLVFEGTFVLAVLFPALAWVYLPTGAAMHLGIQATLKAPFFLWTTLYAAFVPWNRAFRKAQTWLRDRLDDPARVYFDPACRMCLRSVTTFEYLDWVGRLDFHDLEAAGDGRADLGFDVEDLRREMHLVRSDGEVYRGYFAFREIVKRLPVLWPLTPLFVLPGAGRIGPRLYKTVARARARRSRCEDDVCAMHGNGSGPANIR